MLRAAAALVLLAPADALAHAPAAHGPLTLASAWTPDPWTVGGLLLAAGLYIGGVLRLWRRAGIGRGVPVWRAGAFAAGTACLFLALVWPLDALGEELFAAHMAQHMVLLVAAPPLLLLGAPLAPWAAGLPRAWLPAAVGFLRRPAAWAGRLARPGTASLIKGIVLWGWHAPWAFELALENRLVHVGEHICFLGAGLLFWWAVVRPDRRDALAPARAAGGLLVTLINGGMLAALIALAPYPLYDAYAGSSERWGLSPLEDQQLAGLVMWVPAGLVYIGAAMALLGHWLAGLSAEGGQRQ